MKQSIALIAITSLLAACVTINIYFPAAAADKIADKIIDDVWQLKKDGTPESTPTEAQPAPAPETK